MSSRIINGMGRNRKYTEKSLKKFQNEKNGNSAEINLFLVGLLRGVGLEANPVLISTRDHGKIKDDYPFENFFNSSVVLLNIDDSLYLAEGTEPLLPFGLLSPESINEKGLIIKKNSSSWISLNQSESSLISENMILTLEPEKQLLTGKFVKSLTGYDAMLYKKNSALFETDLEGFELQDELQFSEKDLLYVPYDLSYTASTGLEVLDDKIYLTPFLNKTINVNPLKAQTRSYPLDFIYSKQREYISRINIPNGYKILSLPEPKQVDNELFSLDYQIDRNEGVLVIKGSYILKKAVYQSSEYRRIRGFFTLLVNSLNQQVVFGKK